MFVRLGANVPARGKEERVILLIGDAAHIHPPAGGRGMNLGLRDAVFLREMLRKHLAVSAWSPNRAEVDAMLNAYAESQPERTLGVIGFTKTFLWFVSLPHSSRWWMPVSPGLIRDLVVWFCGRFDFWRVKVALGVSGLGMM